MEKLFKRLMLASVIAVSASAAAGCASNASNHSALPQPCSHADGADAPDLGCVNKENLASMVADKGDLDGGKPLDPANGAREALMVEAYEEGTAEELTKVESTTSMMN